MTLVRSLRLAALPVLVFAAGCSDQSRYVMNISEIQPAGAGTNSRAGAIEADILGNFGVSPCDLVQDIVSITVTVEHPGSVSIGPALGAWLTGYRVEFFYYDPLNGVLSGPLSWLTSTNENMRVPAGTHGSGDMTVTFSIPLVSYALKAWSVGAPHLGVAGYAGGIRVDRVVARITVTGEDTTGKKISDDASLLILLNDYGPGPAIPPATPAGGTPTALTTANYCYCVYFRYTGAPISLTAWYSGTRCPLP